MLLEVIDRSIESAGRRRDKNMKMNTDVERRNKWSRLAYTLPEVLVGVSIMSVMFVTLYLGFTQGFGVVQSSRENLRATQILQQYSELIRLYTWDQLTNGTTIPHPYTTNWTFYPLGGTGNQGVTYTGTVTIDAAPILEAYCTNMQQVTFTLTWKTGSLIHQRQVKTLVSQYGLHKYYIPNGS